MAMYCARPSAKGDTYALEWRKPACDPAVPWPWSIKTTEAYLEIGSEAMTRAVQEAEKQLTEKGITTPQVSDWKDPDILQRSTIVGTATAKST